MYFKKLEMVGFKSFYHKTTLNFEPGITAVVGPNGCGKSNIFDAIRWVLGEQSAKELRGSDMQDVIFNGTDTKDSLGMAEVTLVFDNSQKYFPVDDGEVAITRRLFRSGESEYLLNKSPVRLKDILELLMGTGIGAESYSLIQQGKIDLVLSSRPEDRRLVFDEASGITKYKAQKREATRRLEETEQNLLRVNDIVVEVKRQIGSLERQASKARRYKEVFEELKKKEIAYAAYQKTSILTHKAALEADLAGLIQQEATLESLIHDQESRISNRQAQLKDLEEKAYGVKGKIMELESASFRNTERIRFNQEKIQESLANRQYLDGQAQQVQARLSADEEQLNTVKKEYAGIKSIIDEKQGLLKARESQLREITTTIRNALELIATGKQVIISSAASVAAVKNEIADTGAKQQILTARQKRLELERAKILEEKIRATDEQARVTQEVAGLEADFQQQSVKINQVQTELNGQGLSLRQINDELASLERQRIVLSSHREFLQTLKNKYDDISESMSAVVFMDKTPQENMSGLVIKIKEQHTHSGAQPGVFAGAGIKIVGEAKPIDLDTQNISQKISDIENLINDAVQSRTQKETAINLLTETIARKQDDLRDQEMQLVNKKAAWQAVQEEVIKIIQEEDVIALELADLVTDMSALCEKASVLSDRLAQCQLQAKETEDLIHREQELVDAQGLAKEEAQVVIAQIRAELEGLQQRIDSDAATLALLQGSYDQDRAQLDNLLQQATEAQSRVGTLHGEIQELDEACGQAKEEISRQHVFLAEVEAEYHLVSSASVDVVRKIDADRKALDAIKKSIYDMHMQAKDIDYQYQSIKERIMQAYKIDLDEPAACRTSGVEGKSSGESPVVQDAREILGTDVVQDTETASQAPDEVTRDAQALSGGIERLKQKLDSYGVVNLVAIEEYDELKKRYDFLTQQHADLCTAKESLHEAILKINRTTKKMFLDTFDLVRSEFRTYFRLLFGGGDAQVFLTDEHDPLESGIEIICRPPGKKLQNVLLLSGGEKAMAAIALIFAIFKVKPAPFCVLDEIDAALDEANVDRYGRTLHEFSQNSQFIVITHNKKTIVNANVMYGITMEESGISKIVSVKFAKDGAGNKGAQPEPVGVG